MSAAWDPKQAVICSYDEATSGLITLKTSGYFFILDGKSLAVTDEQLTNLNNKEM